MVDGRPDDGVDGLQYRFGFAAYRRPEGPHVDGQAGGLGHVDCRPDMRSGRSLDERFDGELGGNLHDHIMAHRTDRCVGPSGLPEATGMPSQVTVRLRQVGAQQQAVSHHRPPFNEEVPDPTVWTEHEGRQCISDVTQIVTRPDG